MFSGRPDTFPRLLGDIGGTNARFALIRAPGEPISDILNLQCADFPGPLEAIRSYLASTGCASPRQAAMGIANPVTDDWLKMTNNAWAFSIEALRGSLGLERLLFINDFTALALSLPHLSPNELRQIGGGSAVTNTAIGVIGPGTGLGVSGLVPSATGWIPLEGEGGHVSLSPQTAEELAITALLSTNGHVSAERVLSGPGLVCLHQALAQVRKLEVAELDSSRITQAAIDGTDALCVDTLNTFCALLGSTAGNLALTLGARGGVFIGGGIIPKLGGFFDASPFRARFEAKGRFNTYLSAIPTRLITASNPALTGAAAALDQP